MKKFAFLLAGLLLVLSCPHMNAQDKTGIDYFKGTWNITFTGTPNGDVKMVVIIGQENGEVHAAIQDDGGKELYKVSDITISAETAVIKFVGSQGDVALTLVKSNENLVDADIMRMFYSTGERSK